LANETVNVLEGAINVRGLSRIINETVNILEQAQPTIPFVKIVDETVNILEGIATAIGQSRVVDETVNIVEYYAGKPSFYWKANNSLNTETGHTITTASGTPAYTTGQINPTTNGALDGNGWYGDVTPNEFDWDLRTKAVTISLWIYIPSANPNGNDIIIGRRAGSAPANLGWNVFYREENDDVRFEFSDGVTDYQTNTPGALPKDTWIHVLWVNPGGQGNEEIYTDGVPGHENEGSGFPVGTTAGGPALRIGAESDGGGLLANGVRIDELIIWEHALTVEQIVRIWQAGNDARAYDLGETHLLAHPAIVDETENITEQVNRARGVVKQIAETIEINEDLVRLSGLIQINNEVLEITEGTISVRDLVKIVNETVEINELALITLGISRIIDETMNISENAEKILGFAKVLDETVNVTEDVIEKLVLSLIVRVADENINIAETALDRIGIVSVVDEVVNLIENILSNRTRIGVVDETINIEELIDRVIGQNKIVDESVNITENNLTVRGLVRQIGETLQIPEAITSARTMVRIVNENLEISENNIFARGLVRVKDEFLNILEAIRKIIPRISGEPIDANLVSNLIHDLELTPNSITEVNLNKNGILDVDGGL
jgi:hypothetical protein